MCPRLLHHHSSHPARAGPALPLEQVAALGIHRRETSAQLKVVEWDVGADVLLPAVIVRVVVPAGELALLERSPDQSARALREEDLVGDGLHVPLQLCFRGEGFEGLADLRREEGMLRGEGGQVDPFLRVGGQVVELRGVGRARDVLPRPPLDHHHRGDGALPAVLGEHGIRTALPLLEVGEEGLAIHGEGRPELLVHQVHKGGQDVEGRHVRRDTVRSEGRWVVDQQRHAHRGLEV